MATVVGDLRAPSVSKDIPLSQELSLQKIYTKGTVVCSGLCSLLCATFSLPALVGFEFVGLCGFLLHDNWSFDRDESC